MPVGYHGESGDSGGGSFSENLLQAFVDPVSQAIQAWHDRFTSSIKTTRLPLMRLWHGLLLRSVLILTTMQN
ncbi:hypothetical protein THIOSC15_1840008 [uncultured Thiomicrorhabdus sp.]